MTDSNQSYAFEGAHSTAQRSLASASGCRFVVTANVELDRTRGLSLRRGMPILGNDVLAKVAYAPPRGQWWFVVL